MPAAEVFEIPLGDDSLVIAVAAGTDVGAVRRVNEDSLLARPPFLVVADGMGGHLYGDRASRAAVDAIAAALPRTGAVEPPAVLSAVDAANAAVRELSVGAVPGTLSGTTLTGIALVSSDGGLSAHWMIVNVGDSRVYAVGRDGALQLTVDHSVVRELVDAGLITAEIAAVHPERNVVTRALGANDRVDADVWMLPVRGQQSFLVCSDGLTKELSDEAIGRVLDAAREEGTDPARALVDAAITAGGSDNVTVLVIDAEQTGDDGYDSRTHDRGGIDLAARLDDTMPRR